MRINSSNIAMSALRTYSSEAAEKQTTITRRYQGDSIVGVSASSVGSRISRLEVEGGMSVYSTSGAGVEHTQQGQNQHQYTNERKVGGRNNNGQVFVMPPLPSSGDWISSISQPAGDDLLTTMLRMLARINGKEWSDDRLPGKLMAGGGNQRSFSFSFASATARYQETVAMLNSGGSVVGSANAAVLGQGENTAVNGHWTRQTVQSGFVSGQENTAFCSKGSVVTSDGRTIDFNISLEMSRSFEAAYLSASREEVYTDPLVINLDTDAAALSDVSFFFDLNCDGVEEELSALSDASGFLALDKNGDGSINNGSELFGAMTGDGFGELEAYDQDGNGWIDEGDDVFSKLSVWVKCGSGSASCISLKDAGVGAIFLGSRNTQFTLTDGNGENAAMIRKTGLYLKESGQVGTVQHVDFKT